MTSDDSPALGGQPDNNAPDDNSPMISGTPTHAIVSARGAYIAANLYALVDLMSADQQQRFRQTLVREVMCCAHPSAFPTGNIIDRFKESVENWLRNPTSQSAEEPLSILRDSGISEDIDDIYADYPEFLLPAFIAQCISHPDAGAAASKVARRLEGRMSSPQPRTVRWQVEAAWAILQGKEPPSIEEFS
jgi:hypothetical protein